jgi:hypothetical protein
MDPVFCRQNVLFWLVLGAGQAGGGNAASISS